MRVLCYHQCLFYTKYFVFSIYFSICLWIHKINDVELSCLTFLPDFRVGFRQILSNLPTRYLVCSHSFWIQHSLLQHEQTDRFELCALQRLQSSFVHDTFEKYWNFTSNLLLQSTRSQGQDGHQKAQERRFVQAFLRLPLQGSKLVQDLGQKFPKTSKISQEKLGWSQGSLGSAILGQRRKRKRSRRTGSIRDLLFPYLVFLSSLIWVHVSQGNRKTWIPSISFR